jgi:hypothetical protein
MLVFIFVQPEVASATIDLAKAAAVVRTTPEAMATKDWHKELGEKLADHLTNCGFQSHMLGKGLCFSVFQVSIQLDDACDLADLAQLHYRTCQHFFFCQYNKWPSLGNSSTRVFLVDETKQS